MGVAEIERVAVARCFEREAKTTSPMLGAPIPFFPQHPSLYVAQAGTLVAATLAMFARLGPAVPDFSWRRSRAMSRRQ